MDHATHDDALRKMAHQMTRILKSLAKIQDDLSEVEHRMDRVEEYAVSRNIFTLTLINKIWEYLPDDEKEKLRPQKEVLDEWEVFHGEV